MNYNALMTGLAEASRECVRLSGELEVRDQDLARVRREARALEDRAASVCRLDREATALQRELESVRDEVLVALNTPGPKQPQLDRIRQVVTGSRERMPDPLPF